MNAWRLTTFCLAILAGCAGPAATNAPHAASGDVITPQAATSLVAQGATKADVTAALGSAIRISFDDLGGSEGHEVWVYRWPGGDEASDTRAATELVILFDRSGRVVKTRLKPGYR